MYITGIFIASTGNLPTHLWLSARQEMKKLRNMSHSIPLETLLHCLVMISKEKLIRIIILYIGGAYIVFKI